MDSLKLHQLLNYYPAILLVASTLLLAIGMVRGGIGAKRFGLRLIFIAALLTLVVAFTGEFASWDASLYSGARADALLRHKHMATTAFAATEIAGVAALVALLRFGNGGDKGKVATMVAFAVAIIASVLLVTTIFKGRQIKWAVLPHDLRPPVEMRG